MAEKSTNNKSLKIEGVNVRITKRTYTLKQQPNYSRIIYKVEQNYLFQYLGNYTGDIKPDILPVIQAAKLLFEEKASGKNMKMKLSSCYYIFEDLIIDGSECPWRYNASRTLKVVYPLIVSWR